MNSDCFAVVGSKMSISMLYHDLNYLKKLTSSGCSLCVVWAGKENIITPCWRAKLIASKFLLCDAWPSVKAEIHYRVTH